MLKPDFVEFIGFPKISRLNREIIITEKIDGTNAQIYITGEGDFFVASRTRWITPDNDNHGFAKWAYEHKEELLKLGPGRHYGEYWGQGIQRNYGLKEKRFSLFNVSRWGGFELNDRPKCCDVVPTLWMGDFDTNRIKTVLNELKLNGSVASPGYMFPEGIVIYHTASRTCFKVTVEHDDKPKGVT